MYCVNVAINLPIKTLFRQYTYSVPEEMAFLDVGWRCLVDFAGRQVEGFVVERVPRPENLTKLKPVSKVLGSEPWFDKEMIATARWLSEYYMCSLAESMRLFIPGKTSIKMTEKTVYAYSITPAGTELLNAGGKRARMQLKALELLQTAAVPLTAAELLQQGISQAIMRVLAEKGAVQVSEKRILRDTYFAHCSQNDALILTEEQERAVTEITRDMGAAGGSTYLLRGVTGSGKTEVYLQATAEALELGKQVLVLVPEIALTAQLVERFKARFSNQIAVAHSKLSRNERGDVWYKMRSGMANILIGVRSAVFAPFQNLGLVIIDEEHESSYKQEERPSYHAKKVAYKRCRHSGATLVLGSATPSLESYYAVLQGRIKELRLTKRPLGQSMPRVEIVDMRQELMNRNFGVLSGRIKQVLGETVALDEQAIMLLNRRGYSTFVMCRDCGHTITCEHCDVAMVYHNAGQSLRCHYCGRTLPVPEECPSCHSRRIKFFGAGTQKAEEELGAIQGLRPLRMDQDSTQGKLAHEEIIRNFKAGNYNALIGTQMVAKGHDIPKVTFVGVLSADSSLHLPDFRAAERTFDLLTQAAGRAGRGEKPGRVIFQTYDAESPVLKYAAKQDYEAFAEDELRSRWEYRYPPFCEMLKLIVLDQTGENALNLGQRIVNFLHNKENAEQGIEVFGPFPALVVKVRDYYRYNILIKGKDLLGVKRQLLESEFKNLRNVYFDVDPSSVI